MPLITESKTATKSLTDMVWQEDPDKKKKLLDRCEIYAVKSWLNRQPHLPRLYDEQILLFLHSNYYSIERTKETIENYYTFRTHAPEIYFNREYKKDLSAILKVIHLAPIPLKYRTPLGYNMVYLRLREYEASKFDFTNAVKAAVAMLDFEIATNPLMEGFLLIFDMKHFTLGHVARITLSTLKKIMMYIQEAMPIRLKGLHVLNTFPLINQILALVKPLMKQELQDMLYLHTPAELEDFNQRFVPRKLMPSDYGGDLDSVEKYHNDLCKHLQLSGKWLKEIESTAVDESKRSRPIRASDVYGMEGSFKKLDLD